MSTHRMESVAREVQREIAEIVRTEIDDPLIGFVTITDVEMTPDLKHARVYFSVLGSEQEKEDAARGIRRAAKFIRGLLSERIELRYTPDLRFYLDETAERAQRIERLLREEAARAPKEDTPDDGDR
ncbi:MAG TPA: 30S ribosome-binding factor RbfA [Armatimonadota bacterium]|nr:30S ribosome-binding factor RbfA [Armatimonadota bacterium]